MFRLGSFAIVLCATTVGCVRSPAPRQTVHTVELAGVEPTPAPGGIEPEILSAHFAVNDAPPLGGADGLPIVFNVELDATTVVASHFIVARDDGSRARPTDARLSPANESDENRTVLLIGDFGGPDDRPASNVAVAGPLYSEDGVPLRGLAAEVLAFETPPTIVFAEAISPAEGRCASAAEVVRTYWTEGVRNVGPETLAQIMVLTERGQTVHPAAVDDQAVPGQDGAEDNVLDLCLADAVGPVRVQVQAGALNDPAGHPNVKVDVDVLRPRR